MNNTSISWSSFRNIWPNVVSVLKVVLIVIIVDVVLSILLSFFISDAFYFDRYMKGSNYDEMVEKHHNETLYVQPHAEAGWLNTPDFQEGDGLQWATDFIGSRTSPVQRASIDYAEKINQNNLVFLLGSSVIDGYSLPFEHSPAGYLTDSGYAAFGFGTSMYSIDQSYAFYESILSQYRPKVLVVGIHNEAEYISNMFVPFRDDGKFTPFLKPAYHLKDGEVDEFQPPFDFQRSNEITSMLSTLESHDAYFYKYKLYKHLSLLPFSDMLRQVVMRVDKNFYDKDEYVDAVNLQIHFMQKLMRLAKENGTDVIFVKFETLNDQQKPVHKKLLSTLYTDKNTIHTQLLRDKFDNILYISDILNESGRPLSEFYLENDPVHLTPAACRLLAHKINQEIQRIGAIKETQLVKRLN